MKWEGNTVYFRRFDRAARPQAWDWPLRVGTHRVSGVGGLIKKDGTPMPGVTGLISGPRGKLP